MSTNTHDETAPAPQRSSALERLTELRMIIAILFTIYGVVCVVWGIAFTTADDLRRAAGINVNLWAGIAMLVLAAAFALWALRRPLEQATSADERGEHVDGEA